MAAESTPATRPAAGQAGVAAPSMKQTIAATLVVTAIAAAMGALFAIPPAAPSPKDEPSPGAKAPGSAGVLDMPPIVTNLSTPRDTWIRLEASIVFNAKALPHPEVVAGEIAGDSLAYLRTVTLAQLEGPIGLQNIRQDLNERATIRSGGAVTEMIIRTLVVQ